MVQKIEAIKGGGGSVRVGTTGTISSLMTRELESNNSAYQIPASSEHEMETFSGSDPGNVASSKRLQQKRSSTEASSSRSTNMANNRNLAVSRRNKASSKHSNRIPMLGADGICSGQTPGREKGEKKGANMVEIVDIKCGNTDRAWASPITNRLRKLGFSKLSESFA